MFDIVIGPDCCKLIGAVPYDQIRYAIIYLTVVGCCCLLPNVAAVTICNC